MRYISTRVHGVGDYMLGVLLILVAWVPTVEPAEGSVETSLVFGTLLILNGLITDYEFGALGLVTMPFHLWIDLMAGLHIAAAPWFFNFSEEIYLPYLFIGVVVIITGLTTKKLPSYATHTIGRRNAGTAVGQPEGVR